MNSLIHQRTLIMTTLVIIVTLLTEIPLYAQAPCPPEADFTVKVIGDNIVFTASMPNLPNATYEWGWDNGTNSDEVMGTVLTLPKDEFSLVTATAVRLQVTNDFINASCNRDIFGGTSFANASFATVTAGCIVNFDPVDLSPNLMIMSETWNFGMALLKYVT